MPFPPNKEVSQIKIVAMLNYYLKKANRVKLHLSCYLNGFRADRVALPRVLIIGAQKAGTSSLHKYLTRHPQILSGKTKEVQFFTAHYEKGKNYYKRQFPISDKHLLDATPQYLYDSRVPERVLSTLGQDVRFIVSLRNPVERCYSAWNMYREMANDQALVQRFKNFERTRNDIRLFSQLYQGDFPDFDVCVSRELKRINNNNHQILEPSFVRRGFYVDQIQNWLQYFPKEQFFFIDNMQLKEVESARRKLAEIEQFLGIDVGGIQLEELKYYNTRSYSKKQLDARLKAQLTELYQTKNKGLEELTGLQLAWNA